MRLLISACLLGLPCRYDGASKPLPDLPRLLALPLELVPFCPEQLGGLPTPRPPAERRGGGVRTRDGQDVTENYARGAEAALRLARLLHCRAALCKARSPACGCGAVYDGSFSGRLVPGDGVAAERLRAAGLVVCTEENWRAALPPLLQKEGEDCST